MKSLAIAHHLDVRQRLSYRDTGAVASFGPANLEAVTAWRTGKLVFEALPLERVLSQISADPTNDGPLRVIPCDRCESVLTPPPITAASQRFL
ncbi:MAG: hypothetical protein ACREV4_00690 [Gammaproteobacteria bacterium]